MTAMDAEPTKASAGDDSIDVDRLLSPSGGHALALAAASPGEVAVLRYRLPARGCVVRELRGRKMATVSALFDEFAAALQFPYYFGENKDAFDECMRDLGDFLGVATGYILVIRDCERVLSAEADQRAWFYEALRLYAREWEARGSAVFRVVLQGVATRIRHSVTGDLPMLTLPE